MLRQPLQNPILWIHGEALGPANPALLAWPQRPAVFVLDRELLAGGGSSNASHGPLSLKRIGFLMECLLELPVTIRCGAVASEVVAFAERHGADGVVTSQAVDPRFQRIAAQIEATLPLQVLPVPSFVPQGAGQPQDLARFGRYWRRAEPLVWQLWDRP